MSAPIRDLLAPDVTLAARADGRRSTASAPSTGALPGLEPVVDVAAPALPAGYSRASADRLAAQALGRIAPTTRRSRRSAPSGDLLHAAAVIRTKDGRPTGVVVATDYLTGELAARSRRMTQAFENYNQLRVLKRPLTGVYLSFFLMVTLLILVGATWMGLYLAEADHAAGADAAPPRRARSAPAVSISASSRRATTSSDRWSKRSTRWPANWRRAGRSVDRSTRSSSSASTSRSKAGAATSRPFSSASRPASSRSTRAGSDHHDQQRRRAPAEPRPTAWSGSRRTSAFDRAGSRSRSRTLLAGRRAAARPSRRLRRSRWRATVRNCTWPSWRPRWSATTASPEGAVLVLDDVTPLIRAQKVAAWREVARRLAHEIKNPLTPIQLSRRAAAPALLPARRRRPGRSWTSARTTIVGEVESLKGLVDEFSQFARMPSPRTVPTDLRAAHHRDGRALQRHLHRRHASSSGSRRRAAASGSTPSRSGG